MNDLLGWVSFSVAVVSLVVAIVAFLHTYLIHRMNLKYDNLELEISELWLHVKLLIVNRSGLPITLYKAVVHSKKGLKTITCEISLIDYYNDAYVAKLRGFYFRGFDKESIPFKMVIFTTRDSVEVDLSSAYKTFRDNQKKRQDSKKASDDNK